MEKGKELKFRSIVDYFGGIKNFREALLLEKRVQETGIELDDEFFLEFFRQVLETGEADYKKYLTRRLTERTIEDAILEIKGNLTALDQVLDVEVSYEIPDNDEEAIPMTVNVIPKPHVYEKKDREDFVETIEDEISKLQAEIDWADFSLEINGKTPERFIDEAPIENHNEDEDYDISP